MELGSWSDIVCLPIGYVCSGTGSNIIQKVVMLVVMLRGRNKYRRHFFAHGATVAIGPRPPHYQGFTITLRHTTLARTPLDER